MSHGRVLQGPRLSLEEIRALLQPFLKDRGVLKAIVFGSYARGTETRRSDLDLALVLNTDRRFLDRYEHVRGIENVLDGLPLELLIYAPGEIESMMHRPFVRDMVAHGVVIYER